MTVSTGSGGTLSLNADLQTSVPPTGEVGDFEAGLQWQYRLPAGTWTDVGVEALSDPDASSLSGGEFGGNAHSTPDR